MLTINVTDTNYVANDISRFFFTTTTTTTTTDYNNRHHDNNCSSVRQVVTPNHRHLPPPRVSADAKPGGWSPG